MKLKTFNVHNLRTLVKRVLFLYNIPKQMFGGEMKEDRSYICIDLKSFYASVECVERGLDPMTTNQVVADPTRTDKTICLAITPAMKALGIKNRCRVFEIPKGVDYIMAPPRMSSVPWATLLRFSS